MIRRGGCTAHPLNGPVELSLCLVDRLIEPIGIPSRHQHRGRKDRRQQTGGRSDRPPPDSPLSPAPESLSRPAAHGTVEHPEAHQENEKQQHCPNPRIDPQQRSTQQEHCDQQEQRPVHPHSQLQQGDHQRPRRRDQHRAPGDVHGGALPCTEDGIPQGQQLCAQTRSPQEKHYGGGRFRQKAYPEPISPFHPAQEPERNARNRHQRDSDPEIDPHAVHSLHKEQQAVRCRQQRQQVKAGRDDPLRLSCLYDDAFFHRRGSSFPSPRYL